MCSVSQFVFSIHRVLVTYYFNYRVNCALNNSCLGVVLWLDEGDFRVQINKSSFEPFCVWIFFLFISFLYISYLPQVLHNSRVFLLQNALYTNKARFFRARSFCVAKSNANRNSHGLLKYLGSINSYLKSSNAGQHRTKWTSLSTADRHNGHFKSSTL